MATNYDAAVNSFYLAYYGRPADPAGLAYWSQALAQNNGDFSAIIDAFSTSAEATSRFGDATPSDRIADVYQQLFNRKPDAAGLEYWTKAIESGTVSMADAAIQIMNGAQSSDAQLSTLRQEAAAQFTAEVAASGTAYDGAAAVEAARVLIAAITPESSATDIKALVSATKSLVQTAHDNPEVITALASNGNLTSLLTSSDGKTDPVAMVQALASIGKAAASDPDALTTLKQGGGMAGLVEKLPAGASLQDVAQAADKGGITAVTDIVKPAAPSDTTPPAAPTVQLAEDTGASASDAITSNGQIKIGGLEAGATWQYSLDGKTWTAGPSATNGTALLNTTANGDQTLQVRSTDAAGNVSAVTTLKYSLKTDFKPTLAFRDGANGADLTTTRLLTNTDDYWVTLHGGKGAAKVVFQVSDNGKDGTWFDADPAAPLSDGVHFIRDVVTDMAGNTGITNALEVDMDKTAPSALKVALVADTGASATDHITNNGQVKVSGIEAGATWQYSTDGTTWTTGPSADQTGTALLDTTANGAQKLQVRAIDAAGNASAAATLEFTLATTFAPRLAFQGPDGKDLAVDALVTNTDLYWVSLYGAKGAASTSFQISDTGADGTWKTALDSDPLTDGTHFIRYVVTDMAGNTAPSNPLKLVMNHALPSAPAVQLVADTGASATDNITSNGQVKVSGLDATAIWSYSANNGQTWTAGPAVDQAGTALLDLGAGLHHLLVRTFDAVDGTETFSIKALDYTVATTFTPTLAFRNGANGADLTITKLLTNTDDYWVSLRGGKDAAKVVFQVSDTGKDGTWLDADPAAPLADGAHFIRYTVTDLAGNTGTTNAPEVDMDKTPPAAAKVAFVTDSGASATDHVTYAGQVKVSGIDAGTTWQYTDDGTHWIPGPTPDADGNANVWLTNGQHTLQVRVVDAAGNTAVTTMPYTLEGAAPAEGLAFDHVAGGVQGSMQTALAKADLVFGYTGTVDAGAAVSVQYGAGGFVNAGNATIDTAAKTVTLHDVDLTTTDPYVMIGVTSLGGLSTYSQSVKIDGPWVDYSAQSTDAGISVSASEANHVYLGATQVGEALAGTALIGVQTTAAQGVLGVGPSASVHTNNGIFYGLGTAGADTLAGQYVWGYDGDDHIAALGTEDHSDFHTTSAIHGGAGADTISATSGGSTFVYRAVSESTVVAGDSPASGFDTIAVNATGSATHNQVFDFGAAKVDGFYTLASGTTLAGTETGTQLLALINTAVGHNFHVGTVEAAYIGFGANVNFLVVDANADGAIGNADYVVKIVGSVDVANSYVNGSNGHMTLLTA